ncbi:22644_t:CDS:2, partial [Cetraspora pellucida]
PQRTLDFYKPNNDKFSEVTQDDLRAWIMEWIILEDLSFTIVEGQIKNIIERILKFRVVSADTIKCDIIKKYKEMQTNVQLELQEINGITSDSASNNDMMVYHLESWAIRENINFSTDNHFRCFAHVVNLAIQVALKQLKNEIDKIRKLIIKSRSSPQRCQKFSEISNLNSINLSPILDVFEKILLIEEFSDLDDLKLSQSDWKCLENIAVFLKCFAKLSTEMCSSLYPTISAVYPMYNYLMDH